MLVALTPLTPKSPKLPLLVKTKPSHWTLGIPLDTFLLCTEYLKLPQILNLSLGNKHLQNTIQTKILDRTITKKQLEGCHFILYCRLNKKINHITVIRPFSLFIKTLNPLHLRNFYPPINKRTKIENRPSTSGTYLIQQLIAQKAKKKRIFTGLDRSAIGGLKITYPIKANAPDNNWPAI